MHREVFEAASRLLYGKTFKKKELEVVDQSFIKRWYDSKETDFGIYSDPEYIKTLLYCWSCTSAQHIHLMVKNGLVDQTLRSALDFHGGIGMSAVLLARQFPNAVVYNHSVVPEHRDFALRLAREFNLTNVEVVDQPVKADLLLAQETFEHIKDPFTTLRDMLDTSVRPNQYLDGTSFTIPGPGHFTNSGYLDGKTPIHFKKAKRRLNQILKDRGFAHYPEVRGVKKGYNGHPWLWEKTSKGI